MTGKRGWRKKILAGQGNCDVNKDTTIQIIDSKGVAKSTKLSTSYYPLETTPCEVYTLTLTTTTKRDQETLTHTFKFGPYYNEIDNLEMVKISTDQDEKLTSVQFEIVESQKLKVVQ